MVPLDLRNEEEKLSKEQVRCCCQKAKHKVFPTKFIEVGSVEIFCEFDVSSFRNKSQVSAK